MLIKKANICLHFSLQIYGPTYYLYKNDQEYENKHKYYNIEIDFYGVITDIQPANWTTELYILDVIKSCTSEQYKELRTNCTEQVVYLIDSTINIIKNSYYSMDYIYIADDIRKVTLLRRINCDNKESLLIT